jgi:hypothetical protein
MEQNSPLFIFVCSNKTLCIPSRRRQNLFEFWYLAILSVEAFSHHQSSFIGCINCVGVIIITSATRSFFKRNKDRGQMQMGNNNGKCKDKLIRSMFNFKSAEIKKKIKIYQPLYYYLEIKLFKFPQGKSFDFTSQTAPSRLEESMRTKGFRIGRESLRPYSLICWVAIVSFIPQSEINKKNNKSIN